MTPSQREQWGEHLVRNPSPAQIMVRQVYPRFTDYAAEDFAFTVESARPLDIRELAVIGVITVTERDTLLAAQKQLRLSSAPPDCARAAADSGDQRQQNPASRK
jgi:hypothetical protein